MNNVTIYENREFMIFNVSELNVIDFTQVKETSIDTVRKSVDLAKTFVKWDGATPEWTDPNPPFLPQ